MSDEAKVINEVRLGDVGVHAEPGLHQGTGVISVSSQQPGRELTVAWRQLRDAEAALASAASYLRHARQNLQRLFPEAGDHDTPT